MSLLAIFEQISRVYPHVHDKRHVLQLTDTGLSILRLRMVHVNTNRAPLGSDTLRLKSTNNVNRSEPEPWRKVLSSL